MRQRPSSQRPAPTRMMSVRRPSITTSEPPGAVHIVRSATSDEAANQSVEGLRLKLTEKRAVTDAVEGLRPKPVGPALLPYEAKDPVFVSDLGTTGRAPGGSADAPVALRTEWKPTLFGSRVQKFDISSMLSGRTRTTRTNLNTARSPPGP